MAKVVNSTRSTPFKALYGRDPPLLLKGTTIPPMVVEVNKMTIYTDTILDDFKANLAKAQNQMKIYVNKNRREVNNTVGDWVYLKLQPHSRTNGLPIGIAPRKQNPYSLSCIPLEESCGTLGYFTATPHYVSRRPGVTTNVIKEQFPNFHLRDKVKLLGGSIVRHKPPITRTYSRRKPINIVAPGPINNVELRPEA
ncbi:hypothetical protein CR513_31534, partial [Mucuna pruriens]